MPSFAPLLSIEEPIEESTGSIFDWAEDVATSVAHKVTHPADTLAEMWHGATHPAAFAEDAAKAALSVAKAHVMAAEDAAKFARDVGDAAAHVAKEFAALPAVKWLGEHVSVSDVLMVVSMATSVVPGVGTAVSMGLGAAAALAQGKPITDVLLDAAASAAPGGAVAAAAFRAAVAASKGVIHGDRIDAIALDAARNAIPAGPARTAYDAGIALAHGQSLQQAGFAAVKGLVPGDGAAGQALQFAEATAEAVATKKPVEQLLKERLLDALEHHPPELVERAIADLRAKIDRPELGMLAPGDVARRLHVPEELVRAARTIAPQAYRALRAKRIEAKRPPPRKIRIRKVQPMPSLKMPIQVLSTNKPPARQIKIRKPTPALTPAAAAAALPLLKMTASAPGAKPAALRIVEAAKAGDDGAKDYMRSALERAASGDAAANGTLVALTDAARRLKIRDICVDHYLRLASAPKAVTTGWLEHRTCGGCAS